MRRFLILTAVILPQPAIAHVGHLGDLAGHSHWIALGAVGIATVLGAIGALKDRKKSGDTEAEATSESDEDQQQEAAA